MPSAKTPLIKSPVVVVLGCMVLVALLGLANYYIGWEISLAVFYLMPIFIAVHNVGRWAGLLLSVICAGTWLVVEWQDMYTRPHFPDPLVYYWNAMALLGMFVVFSVLMASVESALQKQKGISQNLESLLTLAPYDDKGWDVPSDQPQTAEAKEPHAGM